LSVFWKILFRSSEHSMSVSFALLPQLLFTKLQPTLTYLRSKGICIHSLVVMPVSTLIAFLTVIFLEQYHPTR
jgi:hypothetical protein